MKALTSGLSIDCGGAVLTAVTDQQLAWKWAEHATGVEWAQLSYGQRCAHVGDALAALRAAAAEDEGEGRCVS